MMNYSRDPKQLIAIMIIVISTSLLLIQLASLFRQDGRITLYTPLANGKKERSVIDRHDAKLFTIPLFGQYRPAVSNAVIKHSTLNVTIIGIMYSNIEKSSQVLLRTGNGEEQLYMIGDTLPEGAVIKQIEKNGILVFYNGSLERLSLPNDKLFFEVPAKPLFSARKGL